MQILPPELVIQHTGTAKGRGAYASRNYSVGDVVEVAPVITFDPGSLKLPAVLDCLLFNWSWLVTGGSGPLSALALGYGSLYNHNNPANMRYEADPTNEAIRFIAVRDIQVGEELTINYNAHGGGAEWNDNAWFERKNVDPIVESVRSNAGDA